MISYILNFDHPIRSVIFIYFIFLALIFFIKPTIYKKRNEKGKCLFPIFIIILSAISYYIFIMMSWIKG